MAKGKKRHVETKVGEKIEKNEKFVKFRKVITSFIFRKGKTSETPPRKSHPPPSSLCIHSRSCSKAARNTRNRNSRCLPLPPTPPASARLLPSDQQGSNDENGPLILKEQQKISPANNQVVCRKTRGCFVFPATEKIPHQIQPVLSQPTKCVRGSYTTLGLRYTNTNSPLQQQGFQVPTTRVTVEVHHFFFSNTTP